MSPSPQGKKGKPAAAASADRAAKHRRLGLLVFGVLAAGLFAGVALAQGLGDPSLPEDAVAVVEGAPDEVITEDDFTEALERTAAQQGLQDVPAEDSPEYDQLKQLVVQRLIEERWLLGEAADRGIEVTDREVEEELDRIANEQFGSQKEFEKVLVDAKFCTREELADGPVGCPAAREGAALPVVGGRLEEQVIPEKPAVSDESIEDYYESNPEQFEQPESRDVRLVKTKTEEEASEALAELGEDPAPKSWEEVARKYSIDEATKGAGGLRQAVVEGQSEPALEEEIFSAPEGELVGPFEADGSWYVIRVESIESAQTTPLDDVRDQIRQTIATSQQQATAQSFQEDFTAKWSGRTFCAEQYAVDRCSNRPEPVDACTEEVAKKTGCGAPVPSTRPIAPGSAGVFGSPAASGLPQGPISAAAPAAPELPPGVLPTEPGGAPPPTTAPPAGP